METNPIIPRQRQRRTERSLPDAACPPESSAPVQAAVQPVAPAAPQPTVQQAVQPTAAPQPPLYAQYPVQGGYGQGSYPQGYPPRRPVQPMYGAAPPQQAPAYGQLPQQAPVVQQPAYGQPQPVQPAAPRPQTPMQPTVQYGQRSAAPRPRVLEQRTAVSSGWETPVIKPVARQDVDVPHARQAHGLAREQARDARRRQREEAEQARKAEQAKARKEEAAAREKPARRKLPGWMTTLVSLMAVGVMALVAAYSLMQAYLTTQANERQAAYKRVLANYHITQEADGTLALSWQEQIEKYAAQNNLQPAFVMAIIRNESSFRTQAESDVGARGLMQLMSDTASDVASMLGDASFDFDQMYDGETNIRYGCRYLRYLCQLFGGEPTAVAAAYNAGLRNVQNWLMDKTISPDGVTLVIDQIPFGDTRDYVRKVTQAYGIYQTLLYPDQTPDADGAVSSDRADSLLARSR